MKAHIGVDAASRMVHSVAATAANVADIEKAAELIREDDGVVYGDNGYQGLGKRPEMQEDEQKAGIDCRIFTAITGHGARRGGGDPQSMIRRD
jgi:IS5 family transposase